MKPGLQIILILTIIIVLLSALLNDVKSEWFFSLTKPMYYPPGWVFGVAWSILYTAILIGATLAYKDNIDVIMPYAVLLILTLLWIIVFTRFHSLLGGFIVLLLTLIASVYMINLVKNNTVSLLCFGALTLWVMFATYLNGAYLYLN